MAQKTVDVEVSAIYSFTYDPEAADFKASLRDFQNIIDPGGNEESMLTHVAHNLRISGTAQSMVDGVGYVQKQGGEAPEKLFSGISVEDDDPDFNYEIL